MSRRGRDRCCSAISGLSDGSLLDLCLKSRITQGLHHTPGLNPWRIKLAPAKSFKSQNGSRKRLKALDGAKVFMNKSRKGEPTRQIFTPV